MCGKKGPDNTPWAGRRVSDKFGTRVVNGQQATECEWRWLVSLRRLGGLHFCGGTLVSPRWVLTAAHCVEDGVAFKVTAGDFDKDALAPGQYERDHAVRRTILHPLYNSPVPFAHDFALVELTEEVTLDLCTGTACLPTANVTDASVCYIAGWGTMSSGGNAPSQLREAQVVTLSNADCGGTTSYTSDQIHDSMVCAQGSSSGGITDSCQGDSGGPLVCDDGQGSFQLHGVVSWGEGCAEATFPGVYGRVAQQLDWIHATMASVMTTPPPACSYCLWQVCGAARSI